VHVVVRDNNVESFKKGAAAGGCFSGIKAAALLRKAF